jgi:hypothetical protein
MGQACLRAFSFFNTFSSILFSSFCSEILDRLAGCGKTLFQSRMVIPAEAGIQSFQRLLDSRLRGSDGSMDFSRILLENTDKSLFILGCKSINRFPSPLQALASTPTA